MIDDEIVQDSGIASFYAPTFSRSRKRNFQQDGAGTDAWRP